MNEKEFALSYDVAVIGGGAAGLITAIDLAKAGCSVVVLERSKLVGGRAMTVDKNGARFNLGAHALYTEGEAYRILQEFGLQLEGGTPPTSGIGIWNDKLPALPGNAALLLTSRLLSWSGKMEVGRFMMKLPKLDADAVPDISWREWAELEIRDPMARNLLYALSRTATYNRDIDRQLAGPVLRQVERSLRKNGVRYLHGGWQTIVEQLRELATRSGATILTGGGVAEVELDEASVRGVTLNDGTSISARQVVSTLPPKETFRIVPGAEQTALKRWQEDARPAMAACLDIALRKLPVSGRNFAIGLDRPVFFTNNSYAAKLSTNGDTIVHLVKYNIAGDGNPKEDERELERTMTLLHPNWQQEIVARQSLPAMTVCYDFAHIERRDRKPGPAVPEIRGLYAAGDWASHGEWLLDAAAASARRASTQLLKDRDRDVTSERALASSRH
ncbi:phytoene desaturase family protein [Cohnella soli]|uniref:Phytoene desaturase family protein n=1 Tax=Cohnella soli TaxID=425005 RepID=A0ABW0HYU2_9BACL